MSSFRLVELGLLLAPPQEISATDSKVGKVTNFDQTPSRWPGFLNAFTSSRNLFCPGRHPACLRLTMALRSPSGRIIGPRIPHGRQRLGPRGRRPLQDRDPALGGDTTKARSIQGTVDPLLRPPAG